ncbi:hypothetical protein X802_02255 [Thermococcus guaymasensis DSM 11113]|uniref:Uncharacterized protein n=1 Tax=Thermococcus guaymasensis DSM 11113 TaxID=1432656 RepID=A0A0X1KMZ4_9EURY|nr:hypothetical protein X802_02255 [Thermococcus guaymasensis DSM 11113]
MLALKHGYNGFQVISVIPGVFWSQQVFKVPHLLVVGSDDEGLTG